MTVFLVLSVLEVWFSLKKDVFEGGGGGDERQWENQKKVENGKNGKT